jgi:Tat protein translocase TatB subunit
VRVFGIGTSELFVVAVLALLLFPPKELPKIIRGISQLWGSLRRTADEFKDAILQEEAMQDIKDAVEGTKAQLRDVEGAARRELMKARMEARRAENKLLKVARERERLEREAAAPPAAVTDGAQPAAGTATTPAAGPATTPAAGSATPAAAPAAPVSAPPATTPAEPSAPVPASRPVLGTAPANTVAAGSSVSGSSVSASTVSASAVPSHDPEEGAA